MTIVRNPSTKATGKSSDNLSELVFQKIKNDIFDFKLMPGERFTESEIAELCRKPYTHPASFVSLAAGRLCRGAV